MTGLDGSSRRVEALPGGSRPLGELHFGEVDYYHGIGPWYGQYGWNLKKDFGSSSLLTAGCHALDGALFFMDGVSVVIVRFYAAARRFDWIGLEQINGHPVRENVLLPIIAELLIFIMTWCKQAFIPPWLG